MIKNIVFFPIGSFFRIHYNILTEIVNPDKFMYIDNFIFETI